MSTSVAERQLRDIQIGGMAEVVDFRPAHRSYRKKLLSMGLTRGTVVMVRRVAPLGDPILITVRGFDLSLRRDEAETLVLNPVDGEPEAFGFLNRRSAGTGVRRPRSAGRRRVR